MATRTIRHLDEPLTAKLRVHAPSHIRSMAAEARQILRSALEEPIAPDEDPGARIRARFAGLGDVDLVPEPREPVRTRRGALERLGREFDREIRPGNHA